MQDRVGQQFGSYRLVSLMGQGGFADVYLAQHLYLERQAAIKILQTRLSQESQGAFLKEARTIADLVHPNIIRVLDFGVEGNGNIPFLVMEYAPYGSLRQRYPLGTRLHVNEVIEYVRQVASALQYAHERKIVHRDVKPENMLLGQDGSVLLSDFGIAVISQTSRPGTQDIHGTVAYMAPEQLKGYPQSASDQYALAMTAYELLCGDVPFKGSFAEVGSQHLFAPVPPLKDKVPQLSTEFESVILTALSKEPQQRFATIQAFANALGQAAISSGTVTASGLSNTMMSAMTEMALVPPPPPGYIPNIPVPPPPMQSGMFDPTAPGVSRNLGQQMTPSQPPNIPVPPPPMQSGMFDPTAPGVSRNLGQQMTPSQPPVGNNPPYPLQGSNMHNSGGPFGPVYGPSSSGGVQQGQQTPQTFTSPNQPPAFSGSSNQTTISSPISQSWSTPNTSTQSSSLSQNTVMDEHKVTSPVPPGKPKKGSSGHGGYIAIIVVLLLIILSGGIFAAYAALIHNPFASTASVATATSVVHNTTPTPDSTATAQALANNVTPTPNITAGVTPTVPAGKTYSQDVQNLTLTCLSGCSYNILLVINSITVNTANSSMQWNFTVTNNSADSGYVYTSMDLEDLAGRKLQPSSGNFTEGNNIASGQSLPLLAVFSSLPQNGVTYLMHSAGGSEQYQTISFVFHA